MSACAGVTRITILVDNKANEGLLAEHGLAVWIETAGRRLLFDTGQGPALSRNAGTLDVALHTADTLVLSHGHYDHTGGVPLVIESAPGVHVYCHPGAAGPRYSIRDGSAKSIGMPGAAKLALESVSPGKLHWTTRPIELAPGIGLTGPVPRLTDYEDVGGPFFVDGNGRQSDPIDDDLALWIRTETGLVVIVGCSHAGLINTLRHAQRLSGASRIHAVLGGFHLLEASEARVERTMDALTELGPDLIVPCHCTGERAVEKLRLALGERVLPGSAGTTYTFGGGSEPATAEKRATRVSPSRASMLEMARRSSISRQRVGDLRRLLPYRQVFEGAFSVCAGRVLGIAAELRIPDFLLKPFVTAYVA
jgi:7,8-dihydropterin-6-yl-methyl-4-(beta-D-ribofuranosyl)aminobenzene 5'-phosphate synthase